MNRAEEQKFNYERICKQLQLIAELIGPNSHTLHIHMLNRLICDMGERTRTIGQLIFSKKIPGHFTLDVIQLYTI